MSKVVRITDETFTRLQSHAEPFIDTPSSIIEKLLDFYEGSFAGTVNKTAPSKKHLSVSHGYNLFLASAIDDNINKSVKGSVSFNEIKHLLSEEEKENLKRTTPDLNSLHCWAMTEGSRAVFDAMKGADVVILTTTGSGKFTYFGTVTCKIDNESLGNHLWNVVKNKPWKLVYFLKNVKKINIEKSHLVTEIGYDKKYAVQGVIKVNKIKVDIIISRYESIQNFIEAL